LRNVATANTRLACARERGRRGGSIACQEFVIGGYTIGTKSFDALVFGYYEGDRLTYAARTRNGFTPAVRAQLMKRFKPLEIRNCPFVNLPEKKGRTVGRRRHRREDEGLPVDEAAIAGTVRVRRMDPGWALASLAVHLTPRWQETEYVQAMLTTIPAADGWRSAPLLMVTVVSVTFLVPGCVSGETQQTATTEPNHLGIAHQVFIGAPPVADIKRLMDRTFVQYGDLARTNENYGRAASALVALRKNSGVPEMKILDYMARSHVPGVKLTFPEAAGMAVTFLQAGEK
jgi:hypothetical protein